MLLIVTILCFAAAYLEWRCMKSTCIPDNDLSMAGRRIKIVGYLFFAFRFVALMVEGEEVFVLSLLALGLIALSDVVRCANRLHLPTMEMQR